MIRIANYLISENNRLGAKRDCTKIEETSRSQYGESGNRWAGQRTVNDALPAACGALYSTIPMCPLSVGRESGSHHQWPACCRARQALLDTVPVSVLRKAANLEATLQAINRNGETHRFRYARREHASRINGPSYATTSTTERNYEPQHGPSRPAAKVVRCRLWGPQPRVQAIPPISPNL